MSSPVSLCEQGRDHYKAGRWLESLSCLELALDSMTNNQDKAKIHVQKGYCLFHDCQYELAKAEANEGKEVIFVNLGKKKKECCFILLISADFIVSKLKN